MLKYKEADQNHKKISSPFDNLDYQELQSLENNIKGLLEKHKEEGEIQGYILADNNSMDIVICPSRNDLASALLDEYQKGNFKNTEKLLNYGNGLMESKDNHGASNSYLRDAKWILEQIKDSVEEDTILRAESRKTLADLYKKSFLWSSTYYDFKQVPTSDSRFQGIFHTHLKGPPSSTDMDFAKRNNVDSYVFSRIDKRVDIYKIGKNGKTKKLLSFLEKQE
ncbi:MAG: hypothetical protein KAU95_01245 [Candidatus Aenigmarchaeota archaeon]|nr:hypothetical protein [Candidatus Aenigmarchaeota archaeon]